MVELRKMEMAASSMKQKVKIKKYGNRRLYDLKNKRYITLDEVTELIQQDCEVQVLDSKTGEDLTQSVLTQLILENQKHSPNGLFSSEILHQMIQYQDQSISEFFQQYLPSLLRAYMQWHQGAQNQFMQWAQLSWNANRYRYSPRDFLMPGLGLWGMGGMMNPSQPERWGPEEQENGGSYGALATNEIDDLKRKVEALEKRLNNRKESNSQEG